MKNAQYRYLEGHQILNLKELTDEVNQNFQQNKPKKTLFSKCRTVFVSSNHPTEMVLSYCDPETLETHNETVLLADTEWKISQLKTPEDFQAHYLEKRGIDGGQAMQMMNTLLLDKDTALETIPKKLKPGQFYKLKDKKIKDLESLEVTMSNKQGKWIRSILQRQKNGACIIEKKKKIDNDPKVYSHDDNAVDEEQDLDLDTENPQRVVTENEQVDSSSADKTRRPRPKGTNSQTKDQNVLSKQNKKLKSKKRGRRRTNAVGDKESSSDSNSEINGSNITLTAGTSKDGRRERGRGRGRGNDVEYDDSSSETISERNGSNVSHITAGTSKDGSSKTMSQRKGSSEEGTSCDPTMEVIQKDQCTSDTGLTTIEDTSPQELKQSDDSSSETISERNGSNVSHITAGTSKD
ncbi:MAG: hypothetical protein AAGM46_24850, partial [Cyanobacteria bacterium J06582_2]